MESIIQDLNKFGEEEICTELTLQSFSSWAKKKKCKIVLPKVKPITFDCETILKPRSCFTPIQKKIYELRKTSISPKIWNRKLTVVNDYNMLGFLFRNKEKVILK